MFEFFRKPKPVPVQEPVPAVNPITHTFSRTINEPVPGLIVPGTVMLVPKKWVTVSGKVGIVTKIDSSSYVTVDMVNEKGETIGTERVPAGAVKLARYMEIPGPRRGDQVVAATLGYV